MTGRLSNLIFFPSYRLALILLQVEIYSAKKNKHLLAFVKSSGQQDPSRHGLAWDFHKYFQMGCTSFSHFLSSLIGMRKYWPNPSPKRRYLVHLDDSSYEEIRRRDDFFFLLLSGGGSHHLMSKDAVLTNLKPYFLVPRLHPLYPSVLVFTGVAPSK